METLQASKRTMAAAAKWFARLTAHDVSPEDRAEFVRWIEQSSEHKSAYEQVSAVWLDIDHIDRAALDELARDASVSPDSLWRKVSAVFSRPLVAAGAVGVTASAIGAVIAFSVLTAPTAVQVATLYETAVGERREVALDDGSEITLNTGTTLRVEYSKGERNVMIEEGEAFFAVAPDQDRPFRIAAGPGRIEVLGTRFNVRFNRDETRVAVVEGRVAFSMASQSAPPGRQSQAVLTTGEGGKASDVSGLDLYPVDIEQITAWREGRFVFRATPLSDVVSEINRYSAKPVRLDEDLSALKITGVFSTERIPDLLAALEDVAPVEVEYTSRGARISASDQ